MKQRILLVDAYRHSREGVRDALVAVGWLVETASDSWQAVRKIRDGGFAVAVVDLDLPPVHGESVSGWDLVRICQVFNPTIPVVVVGADGAGEARALGQRIGVARLLVKPIDVAELKAAVLAVGGAPSRCGRDGRTSRRDARVEERRDAR